MSNEMEISDEQQRFAIKNIREIDIYELTQRGLIYVDASRSKGILDLERFIKEEPLDIFRETLELLVDGCSAAEIRQFLATSKKQTQHHIDTLFSLVENMTISAKEGDNPKLVKRYAELYITGGHLKKVDKS